MEIISTEIIVFCKTCKKHIGYTIFKNDKKLYCECGDEIEIEKINIDIKLKPVTRKKLD